MLCFIDCNRAMNSYFVTLELRGRVFGSELPGAIAEGHGNSEGARMFENVAEDVDCLSSYR